MIYPVPSYSVLSYTVLSYLIQSFSNTYIDAQRSGMPLISRTEEVAVYSDRSYKKFEQVRVRLLRLHFYLFIIYYYSYLSSQIIVSLLLLWWIIMLLLIIVLLLLITMTSHLRPIYSSPWSLSECIWDLLKLFLSRPFSIPSLTPFTLSVLPSLPSSLSSTMRCYIPFFYILHVAIIICPIVDCWLSPSHSFFN